MRGDRARSRLLPGLRRATGRARARARVKWGIEDNDDAAVADAVAVGSAGGAGGRERAGGHPERV